MLLAVTCAVTTAALEFEIDVTTPMSVVVACLPMLAIYPVAISGVTFALASRVAHQNRRLEEMGRTDDLTGLANRRKGFAVAEAELERHRRSGRAVTLLMLDVDRFKDINDRHGHPAGDDVLCGVADVLRKTCRATDTPCRYGGDEFLLILPETDLRGAQGVADRIRAQLEGRAFDRAPGPAMHGGQRRGGRSESRTPRHQRMDTARRRRAVSREGARPRSLRRGRRGRCGHAGATRTRARRRGLARRADAGWRRAAYPSAPPPGTKSCRWWWASSADS